MRRVDPPRDEPRQVEHVARVAAQQLDPAAVGGGLQAARTIERLDERHRHVVDRLVAGIAHLAFDVDLLAAVRRDAHGDLRIAERFRERDAERIAHLGRRPARNRDRADIRKLHAAVLVDDEATDRVARPLRRRRLGGRRRRGQLRVVPHRDLQHVARADAVTALPTLGQQRIDVRRPVAGVAAVAVAHPLQQVDVDLADRHVERPRRLAVARTAQLKGRRVVHPHARCDRAAGHDNGQRERRQRAAPTARSAPAAPAACGRYNV
jgi:hypothetical protein